VPAPDVTTTAPFHTTTATPTSVTTAALKPDQWYAGFFGVADTDWCKSGSDSACQVHNQGQLGSSLNLAIADVIESRWAAATGSLQTISKQQLLDCVPSSQSVFDFTASNDLCTESSYPFTGETGTCRPFCLEKAIRKGSIEWKVATNEAELGEAVKSGMVVVSVNAASFTTYSGGVISSDCPPTLDHAMVLVGDTSEYWRTKNSWGASWGEAGFVRLGKGISEQGECGVASDASYPVISASVSV